MGQLKILFLADVHLKAVDPFGSSSGGRDSRTMYKLDLLERVLVLSAECGCDLVVIGGDLFDGPNPPTWLRARVSRILRGSAVPVWYVVGNHEWGVSKAFESEGLIGESEGFRYISEVHSEVVNGFRVVAASTPFVKEALQIGGDILLSHCPVDGARISSALVFEGSGLSASDFRCFDLVLLGDFHIPQSLRGPKHGLHYPGAFCVTSVDEIGLEVGSLLVEMSGEGVYMEKWLTPEWEFKRFQIGVGEIGDIEAQEADVIVVEVKGRRSELKGLSMKSLKEVFSARQKFILRFLPEEGHRGEDSDLEKSPLRGLMDEWKDFCSRLSVDERVCQAGALVIEECLES